MCVKWTQLLAFCVICLQVVRVTGSAPVNFTTDQVINTHDYPKLYRPGVSQTWIWTADSGLLWGIKFCDVDLKGEDTIIITDGKNPPIYFTNLPKTRHDTGPSLNITFISDQHVPKGRGFKLDVRRGKNKRDLEMIFLETNPEPIPTGEPIIDLKLILPLLLITATVIILLFLFIVSWLICRRRRQQQEVSLSVNVQGGIRRDSGIRYTRKPSTVSQTEEPQSPRKPNLVRSNSNRSWMVRAELTSTTRHASTSSATGCNGNVKTQTMPNVYTEMQTVDKSRQGNMILDVRGQMLGRTNAEVFRSPVSTLERVPEGLLMTTVPASSLDVSNDDGYLGPTPSSPAVSYLNCPVSKSKFYSSSAGGRCEAEYRNITVTGIVDIS